MPHDNHIPHTIESQSPTNGVATKIDIAILKTKVESVEKAVDLVTSNHLPHIYQALGDIKVKMAYYIGGAAAIGIIVQFIVAYISSRK